MKTLIPLCYRFRMADIVAEGAIPRTVNTRGSFVDATEGGQRWAIRMGAEPVDMHLGGKGTAWDMFVENDLGFTAGVGGMVNHNYIEVGRFNDAGEFEVMKRVHGLGLDANMEMTGGGRLVGFVVDGKYTPFSRDPIQRDDPHATRPNQLQHADEENWFSDNATKIVFEGSERQVLQLYGAMVESTIELNKQNLGFSLTDLNSNSFNSAMKEKLTQMGGHLGITIGTHDAGGWDLGSGTDLNTSPARLYQWESMGDLRGHIDSLERAAATQLQTIYRDGIDVDLGTTADGHYRPPGRTI